MTELLKSLALVLAELKGARLSRDEMLEVMKTEPNAHLVIAGYIEDGVITLWRGDFTVFTVPTSTFTPSGTAAPDFDEFAIIDYGHTLKFGEYEAAVDWLLKSATT